MRDKCLPQVNLRVSVEENATAAKNEHIEALNFKAHLLPSQVTYGHRALDFVPSQSVLRITRKNGDFYLEGGAQLGDDSGEYGFIAQIHTSVRTGYADTKWLHCFGHVLPPWFTSRQRVSSLAVQFLAFRPAKVKATPIRCRRARGEIENPAGARNCASPLSVEPHVEGKKLQAAQPLLRHSTRRGALEMLRLQYC